MANKTAQKTAKSTDKMTKTRKTSQKGRQVAQLSKESENQPKNIHILGFNNLPLCTYVFDKVENPKAVVVIVHGMQEHALRYASFAKFLNKHGFVVVASDSRGHGRTMQSKDDYGRGEKDIFSETVKDQQCILDYAKTQFNLPIYLLGHSYGSMILQKLIQVCPLIEKAVICGTTNGDSFAFKSGSVALSVLLPFKQKDKRGGIEEKLCIKSFEKKFENGNWLSRNEESFAAYCADPLCGGSFPFSFYYSLIKNMRKVNRGINKVHNKNIFFIAGGADPLSSGGKEVEKLFKKFLKNNINARLKIYSDARHELLNEINNKEVYEDVLKFFEE